MGRSELLYKENFTILSLNDIVSSSSVRIAGNSFDQDIINYIREQYKLLIGEKTAEEIKKTFVNLTKPSKKKKREIRGRSLITGLPQAIEVTQEEISMPLLESINKLIKETTKLLEEINPELSSDIVEKGIVLTGGGALVKGLLGIFKQELKVPVLIASSPLTCVAEGTGVLLENIKMLEESH